MDAKELLKLEKLRRIQRSIDYSDIGLDTPGGKLSAEDADAFITYIVSEGDPFFRSIQVIPMFSETRNIDVFNIPGRQLRKKEPGIDPANPITAEFPRNILQAVKTMLQLDIQEEVFEENIEKEGFEGTLLRQFAIAYSNDILDLGWNGNEAEGPGVDQAFLSINDGWIVKANDTGNTLDASAYTSHMPIWMDMLIQMPRWFKANKDILRIFVSPNTEIRYRAELEQRETAMGDAYLDVNRRARYQGVLIEPLGVIPDEFALLINPQNIVFGLEYSIAFERDKNIKTGVHEIVMTSKCDFQYAINNGLVLAYNIPIIGGELGST